MRENIYMTMCICMYVFLYKCIWIHTSYLCMSMLYGCMRVCVCMCVRVCVWCCISKIISFFSFCRRDSFSFFCGAKTFCGFGDPPRRFLWLRPSTAKAVVFASVPRTPPFSLRFDERGYKVVGPDDSFCCTVAIRAWLNRAAMPTRAPRPVAHRLRLAQSSRAALPPHTTPGTVVHRGPCRCSRCQIHPWGRASKANTRMSIGRGRVPNALRLRGF